MKILIINGSPRINGFTASLLHGIENHLSQMHADVEFFDLSTLSMSQCAGCCSCYATGHCFMKDDAEMLSEKIKEADGLILGSPTYASNVSGYMKLLIDRGHFVIEQLLTDKYCITVTTGENYGSRDASKVLNNLVIYSGGRLTQNIVRNAPFNSKDTDFGKDSAERLYSAISHKKKYPFQSLFHALIFNLGIRGFVRKKGSAYKGVPDKWKALGIV